MLAHVITQGLVPSRPTKKVRLEGVGCNAKEDDLGARQDYDATTPYWLAIRAAGHEAWALHLKLHPDDDEGAGEAADRARDEARYDLEPAPWNE